MKITDYAFFIYMALSLLICIVSGIVVMVKTKNKNKFNTAFLIMLVGFTPAAVFLVSVFLAFGFITLIGIIPNIIFDKLKTK